METRDDVLKRHGARLDHGVLIASGGIYSMADEIVSMAIRIDVLLNRCAAQEQALRLANSGLELYQRRISEALTRFAKE